ncbi:MAG: dinitrogenase iron-molybdenum cofactor biosynthesis protein, partial [bacterium]|nr:dinitrogenase iron-molybdenum cofactor biosynthesis protein [bacterium]
GAGTGADIVIAPSFGPKAFQVLKAAGVKPFISTAETVAKAIEEYRTGSISESDAANVEGHW